jgi:murein DD-endopeptidase MepM/ murein hydrolase activator NlpD
VFRSLIVRYGVHVVLLLIVIVTIGVSALKIEIEFPSVLLDYSKLEQPVLESGEDGANIVNSIVSYPEGSVFSDQITRTINLRTHIPSRPRQEVITYTVRSGDTLFGISEKYGITPETILWSNAILKDDPHLLRPDQELLISPVTGVVRVVHEGDTVDGLASVYRADAEDIINWPGNQLDPDNPALIEDSVIVVPGGERDFVQWTVPRIARAKRNPLPMSAGPGACTGGYQGGAVGSGSFIWPASNRYLSGYNYSGYHPAIDIAAGLGAPIYASDSGVVVFAGWSNWGYGYMVVVDHGNGWQTLYSHLSQWNVNCGQSVYQGTVLGLSGSTGNSTGPHLHFEINYQGTRVNPWNYLP